MTDTQVVLSNPWQGHAPGDTITVELDQARSLVGAGYGRYVTPPTDSPSPPAPVQPIVDTALAVIGRAVPARTRVVTADVTADPGDVVVTFVGTAEIMLVGGPLSDTLTWDDQNDFTELGVFLPGVFLPFTEAMVGWYLYDFGIGLLPNGGEDGFSRITAVDEATQTLTIDPPNIDDNVTEGSQTSVYFTPINPQVLLDVLNGTGVYPTVTLPAEGEAGDLVIVKTGRQSLTQTAITGGSLDGNVLDGVNWSYEHGTCMAFVRVGTGTDWLVTFYSAQQVGPPAGPV